MRQVVLFAFALNDFDRALYVGTQNHVLRFANSSSVGIASPAADRWHGARKHGTLDGGII